jgi:WD40 repeat protein
MAQRNVKVGTIKDVSGEVNIAGHDIIKNIKTIYQCAVTAAEEAASERKVEGKLLAQGVSLLAKNLSTQASQSIEGDSPYKGLLTYNLNEAEIFFGRKEAKKALLRCINQDSLTILHAESGAGKSSLLQAGIAAQLIANGHLAIRLRSHNADPVDFIKRTFLPELSQAPALAKATLREFLRQVCAVLGPMANLYLLLDQFEEFFNLLTKEERQPFLESLADCLNDPGLKVRWVLAIRAEALSNFSELESFGITPFKNLYRLSRLSRVEAQEIIIEPAKRYGINFEQALIDHILDTLTTNNEITPTQLQLVCSALTDDLPENKILTLAYYTNHEGGTEGILRDYLKRQLEHLPTADQAPAWKVLRALITADSLRVVKTHDEVVEELKLSAVSEEQIDTLLARLVERRLLITQSATIETFELAHDYLIKEIKLDPQERARKAAQEMLDQETRTYQRYKTLLTAERLAVIEPYQKELRFSPDAKTLWSDSRKAVQQEQRLRERRRNITLGITTVVAIAMSLLALWGFRSSEEAKQHATIARTRELAASAIANLETDPELGILLAMQAVSVTDTADNSATIEAANALHRALAASRVEKHLIGHTDRIFSGSFSQDGKRVATASWDGQIKIWDAVSGKELFSLTLPSSKTQQILGFSPNSKTLFTFEDDSNNAYGSIHAWDISNKNAKEIFIIKHQSGLLAQNPDGTMLATVTENRQIQLTDALTGERIKFFPGVNDHIFSMTFSTDGKNLTMLHGQGGITVLDIDLENQFVQLPAGKFYGVELSPDGKLALNYGGRLQVVTVWGTVTGQKWLTLSGHTDRVESAEFSPDGKWIVSGSLDGTVKLWDATTGQQLLSFVAHQNSVNDLAFSGDGMHLVTVSDDATAKIWDLSPRAEGPVLSEPGGAFSGVSYSPDGTRLATSNFNGSLKIWDATSGKELSALSGRDDGPANAICFSPDGKLLVSGYYSGFGIIWDITTRKRVVTLAGHTSLVLSAVFDPRGNYVATGSEDGTAKIWDAHTGQELRTLAVNDGFVYSLAFSPDGKLLATASSAIRIWDAASGELLRTLSGHKEEVYGVAFSPTGQQLVTGSRDNTAKLWDVKTGAELYTLSGHTGWVYSVTFSPDGKELATSSQDRTVRLWDVETGLELLTLTGQSDQIYGVAFSPDGKRLATASLDGTIYVYILPIQELMELAATRVTRDLTCSERVKYLHEKVTCSMPTPVLPIIP